MKKIMLAGLACTAMMNMAGNAAVSATGFFGEVNGGGSYNKIKLYLAGASEEKKDKKEFVEEHKNAGFVGGAIGYGYEFVRGFYVGVKAYVNYDFAKIEKKQDFKADGNKFLFKSSDSDIGSRSLPVAYDMEYKPMCNFGGGLQVGFKIMPNILVYASVAAEGTYSKLNMVGEFAGIAYMRMGDKTPQLHALLYKSDTESSGYATLSDQGEAAEKAKVTTFSLVPGLGLKWFITPNIYVGAEVNIPCGFTRKIDAKYYSQSKTPDFNGAILHSGKAYAYDATTKGYTEINVGVGGAIPNPGTCDMGVPTSLNANGNTLYVKRVVSVRYGLIVGFKF